MALSAGGSVRDSESLLGQALTFAQTTGAQTTGKKSRIEAGDIRSVLGMTETKAVEDLARLVAKKDAAGAVNYLNTIVENGYDVAEYAKNIVGYLRQALILSIIGTADSKNDSALIVGLTEEEFARLKVMAGAMGQDRIKKTVEIFLAAQEKIKYSPIPQLPLELAIVESCAIQ